MKNAIFSLSEKSCSKCRFWTNFCNFINRKMLHFYLHFITKCSS